MKNLSDSECYSIPKKYRVIENLHIVFWLIKDICWCILFKPLAIAMIFPTLIVGIYITWQNRTVVSELYHNLAVIFWISANSFWMISEFFGFDEKEIFVGLTGKNIAVIPFSIGLLLLFRYYFFLDRKVLKT